MEAERARAALATAVRDDDADDARARVGDDADDDESSQRNVRAIARGVRCRGRGRDAAKEGMKATPRRGTRGKRATNR